MVEVVAVVVDVVAVAVGVVVEEGYGGRQTGYWVEYGYGVSIVGQGQCPSRGVDQSVGYAEDEVGVEVEDDAPDATFARVSSDRKTQGDDYSCCGCCSGYS